MAPQGRLTELRNIDLKKQNPRKAAVMALFYPDANEVTQLLLILRKTYKGVHSNQVGFPGGKEEKEDNGLLTTALRETHEEVGVHPLDVKIVKKLSTIYIPPSNFVVQPYLGLYPQPRPFVKQESEVESLLEVPITDFLNENNLITRKLSTSYAMEIEVPAFELNGHVVWGATAMMLNEIKELVKQVL